MKDSPDSMTARITTNQGFYVDDVCEIGDVSNLWKSMERNRLSDAEQMDTSLCCDSGICPGRAATTLADVKY